MARTSRPGAGSRPPLREARAADFERLWSLDQVCFDPGIAYSRRELRRFLDLPRAACLLAESRGELLGFALGYSDSGGLAHVVTLDVDRSHRKSGLGRRLLEALLEKLAARGARRGAILEVDVRNSGAIEFYRKLGFQPRATLRSYYGPGLDAFEMARDSAGSAG
jgi:ribosomal-protein-alanine N-acetyltransferase